MTVKYFTAAELHVHSKNVRAKALIPEGSIEAMAKAIEKQGLLQNLVVQWEADPEGMGVLAGRRRLLAIQMLIAAKTFSKDYKVRCLVIAKDVDHVTAISLAENEFQEPMDPLSEYEAYAQMLDEKMTAEDIASLFSTTVRHVKDRLRIGLVHPDIRQALRDGAITLDTLKAYACHPCQETQKRTFDAFLDDEGGHSSWRVRETLNATDLRASDPRAAFVLDEYRKRKGEVIPALFEEETVLKDLALVDTIIEERLAAAAEEARAAMGFAWAETRPVLDRSELSSFGRIYPKKRKLSAADQKKISKIAEKMDTLSEKMEDESISDEQYDAFETQYEDLQTKARTIQEAFDKKEVKNAGVIAYFDHDQIMLAEGIVRPEDMKRSEDPGKNGAASDLSQPDDADQIDPAATLSASLVDDLKTERSLLIAAKVAHDPDLAYDMMAFKVVSGALDEVPGTIHGMELQARGLRRAHARPEAIDPSIDTRMTEARDALDLTWADHALSGGERFRRFRALDKAMKAQILAYAVAHTIEPSAISGAGQGETFQDAFAAEAIADIRDVWTPTTANYWERVTIANMKAVLAGFGLEATAAEFKQKRPLAQYMEKLFAEPFATLTVDQREQVARWTPPGMSTKWIGDDDEDAAAEEGGEAEIIGTNADGHEITENAEGVRSVHTGKATITEPVQMIPTPGGIETGLGNRRPEFLTVDEAAALEDRKDAA